LLWYGYLLDSLVVGLIVAALVRSPERYRGQMSALLVAIGIPLTASVFNVLRAWRVDPAPIAMTFSGAALAWAIFRRGFLDMIPAARHTIIENMSDAMVVLDQSHRVVDLNPAARRLLGRERTAAIGRIVRINGVIDIRLKYHTWPEPPGSLETSDGTPYTARTNRLSSAPEGPASPCWTRGGAPAQPPEDRCGRSLRVAYAGPGWLTR